MPPDSVSIIISTVGCRVSVFFFFHKKSSYNIIYEDFYIGKQINRMGYAA